ncbi:MAG: pectin esterase [Tidjanibacter sp.]|nr:pectin esterase [Tidjanibacter sp.]
MKRLATIITVLALALTLHAQTTVFVCGDSTAATKDITKGTPERGWGHVLQPFFDPEEVVVENHAKNGRSTKSFVTLGHWATVEERMKAGDYVFIEFGHNDTKVDDTVRFTTPEQYGRNLEQFIEITRAKGATPVLLTQVCRRWWKQGVLADSHGDYLKECHAVAERTGVLFIDAEKLTRDWLEPLGDEGSQKYFMNLPAGKYPSHPDGKNDNTHFTVPGARIVARMICREIERVIPELGKHIRYWDFVVAKDGSGDFFTIKEAIDALPNFYKGKENPLRVLIREGVYEEKLVIPYTKQSVEFIGEGDVKITWGDGARDLGPNGTELGTSGTATLYNCGRHIVMENITIENSAGEVGQAVALQTVGNGTQIYRNCRLLGNQDTLYIYGVGNRDGEVVKENINCYFDNCYIEGTTDFIFGSGRADFTRCTIHSKKDSYITAASTCKGQERGFTFLNCKLTAAEGVAKCYLGRPWRIYAKTYFINCEMGGHIRPEGWHNWKKPEAERTAAYGEYDSTGEGANPSQRVKWAKKISDKKAQEITLTTGAPTLEYTAVH